MMHESNECGILKEKKYGNEQGKQHAFQVEDVNWEELAGIGILKDELEMSGELDTLLKGRKRM